MAGIIYHLVLVLLCTLIAISTAQKAFQREADDKNQTKQVANIPPPPVQGNISISSSRHSTIPPPSLQFPEFTKHTSRFLRRRHPRRRYRNLRHWWNEDRVTKDENKVAHNLTKVSYLK